MEVSRIHVAYGIAALGALLAAVVPELLEETASNEVLLGLSFAGGVTLFAGSMWAEHVRHATGRVDERFAKIHYRSGWNAFWAMVGLLMTGGFVTANVELGVGPDVVGYVIPALLIAGIGVLLTSMAYYKRVM